MNTFIKRVFTEIVTRVKHRKVLLTSSYLLAKIGIHVIPYYITREYPLEDLSIEPNLESLSSVFLSTSEIEKLSTHPDAIGITKGMNDLKKDGCLCFALKHNEEIIAYTWCNLRRCHYENASFALGSDEAYLFRARTFNAYRGKNLAPLLRYRLYKNLVEMGRTKFYSVTEYFNTPALNFKKKLGAKHLKLCLYLGIFNVRLCNITLKNYKIPV